MHSRHPQTQPVGGARQAATTAIESEQPGDLGETDSRANMITTRQVPLALATASRRGTTVLMHRCQRQAHRQSSTAAPASQRSTDKPPPAVGHDPDNELLQLEEEYSTLKVNWFPGHMVKATKVIREKLKQVCGFVLFHAASRDRPRPLLTARLFLWGMHAYPHTRRGCPMPRTLNFIFQPCLRCSFLLSEGGLSFWPWCARQSEVPDSQQGM